MQTAESIKDPRVKGEELIKFIIGIVTLLPNAQDNDEMSESKINQITKAFDTMIHLNGIRNISKEELRGCIYHVRKESQLNASSYKHVHDPDVYKDLLPYARVAWLIENNGDPEDHARRLTHVFGDTQSALQYLTNFAMHNPDRSHPFHDACIPCILPEGKFLMRLWQTLAQKFLTKKLNSVEFKHQSEKFLAALANASAIEKIAEKKAKIKKDALEILGNPGNEDNQLKKFEEELLNVEPGATKNYLTQVLSMAKKILLASKKTGMLLLEQKKLIEQLNKLQEVKEFKDVKDLKELKSDAQASKETHNPETVEQHKIKQEILELNSKITQIEAQAKLLNPDDAEKIKSEIEIVTTRIQRYEEGKRKKETKERKEGTPSEKIQQNKNKVSRLEEKLKKDTQLKQKSPEEVKRESDYLNELKKKRAQLTDQLKKMTAQNPEKLQKKIQRCSDEISLIKQKLQCALTLETPIWKLEEYLEEVQYKNWTVDSEASRLFKHYNKKEAVLNKYLSLTPVDAYPEIFNVFIDGATLGFPEFYIKKLDSKDPSAAVLGDMTGCCQSLGSAGEACVIYGITSPYSGFYVLCKGNPKKPSRKDKIISQTWFWLSTDKNIVFDSIETTREKSVRVDTKMINLFFETLAYTLVTEKGVHQVSVGRGSTPRSLGFNCLDASEIPIDYKGHRDSDSQIVVANKDRLGLSMIRLGKIKEAVEYINKNSVDVTQDSVYCFYTILSDNVELFSLVISKFPGKFHEKINQGLRELVCKYQSTAIFDFCVNETLKIEDSFENSTFLIREIGGGTYSLLTLAYTLDKPKAFELIIERLSKNENLKEFCEITLAREVTFKGILKFKSQISLEMIVNRILQIKEFKEFMDVLSRTPRHMDNLLWVILKLNHQKSLESIVNRIMEQDPSVIAKTLNECSPSLLFIALHTGNLALVKKLLSAGAAFKTSMLTLFDPNNTNFPSPQPEAWICLKYLIEQKILDYNAVIVDEYDQKRTHGNILTIACQYNSKHINEFIKYLLNINGIDTNKKSDRGFTPHELSIMNKNSEISTYILYPGVQLPKLPPLKQIPPKEFKQNTTPKPRDKP